MLGLSLKVILDVVRMKNDGNGAILVKVNLQFSMEELDRVYIPEKLI